MGRPTDPKIITEIPRVAEDAPQLTLGSISPMAPSSPRSTRHASHTVPSSPPPQMSPLTESHRSNTPNKTPTRRKLSRTLIQQNLPTEQAPSLTSSPGTTDGTVDVEGSPWSGAVGPATLGRTSRALERYAAQVDKLRRELNAERQHREEVERRDNLSGSTIERLQVENTNLRNAKEQDDDMITRRDRKITDLKQELESEKARRLQAEETAREALHERDEVIARTNQDLGMARENEKHADVNARILQESHKQLDTEYRTRLNAIKNSLQQRSEGFREQLRLRDVVQKQQQHDIERMARIHQEQQDLFQKHEQATDSFVAGLAANAKSQEQHWRGTLEQAEVHIGDARHWIRHLHVLREVDPDNVDFPEDAAMKSEDSAVMKVDSAHSTARPTARSSIIIESL